MSEIVNRVVQLHRAAAEKGGAGRVLFGVCMPLVYPLVIVGVLLYFLFGDPAGMPSGMAGEPRAFVSPPPDIESIPPMPEPIAPAPVPVPMAAAEVVPVPLAVARAPASRPATADGAVRRAPSGAKRGWEWLLAQPAERYTLQLLGVHDEAWLRRFVRQHQLGAEAASYRTVHQGGDWFVLLWGDFPDREAALAAVERLPKAVRKNRPWPRAFNSVQQAIRATP